jgi:hypothetical protein
MPGSTTPDALQYPVLGDTASPRLQIAALATSVQAALENIRSTQAATRVTSFYGPAADLAATLAAAKNGDLYQESDGGNIVWKKVGGVWVTNEVGRVLIRPTVSGTGIHVDPDGTILFAGTPSGGVHIEDCFSTRFRYYEIVTSGVFSSNAALQFQMRVGGTTTTPGGTDYKNSYIYNTSASALGYVQNDLGYFAASGAGGTRITSRILFTNPSYATATQYVADTVVLQGAGPTLVQSRMAGHHAQSVAYTGFTVTQSNAQAYTGNMKIYGYN